MSKTTISNKMLRPMPIEAIEKAARADPDAQPLTEADISRMKRTPRVKIIRRTLELTEVGYRVTRRARWLSASWRKRCS
jgi:hypothetical protein